jgi:hypothetical protein
MAGDRIAGNRLPGNRIADNRLAGRPAVRRPPTVILLFAVLAVCSGPGRASAEPSPDDGPSTPAEWLSNLRAAAEAMEWSDRRIAGDWRLQQQAGGGRFRLLDPSDEEVASGTREECTAAFETLARSGRIPGVSGETVLVLHGLGQSRESMRPLVDYLRSTLDATVMAFGYASPREDIDAHARSLASVIEALPGSAPISFVGHSLGGIVVRRWMGLASAEALRRSRRLVMLGSPNQGSELARLCSRVWLLATLADGAARDLVVDWDRVAPSLAVPPCPFGIVAGGRGDDRGFSDLLSGDDDTVVRVDEARLDGAEDFLLVPVRHAGMMKSPVVQRATASFLRHGRFEVETADGRILDAASSTR